MVALKGVKLYDAAGRVVMRSQVAFDGAGTGRRARHWMPGSDSINSITSGSADLIRRRSRDMVRRNAWASSAKKKYVSNIIGTGMKPIPQAPDTELRTAVRDLWERSVDECDADGLTDFYGLQALAVGEMFDAGECFARMRPRYRTDGLAVPLQLQLLPPDFLRQTHNENLGGRRYIRQGIEFDALGRRVAYHFYRDHPGERFRVAGIETTRVLASEVIHLFEPLEPGQIRGLPATKTILAKLYELDQYDDATLMRQRIASLFAFFFTRPADEMGTEEDSEDAGARIATIEPGTGYELAPGESIETPEVPTVGSYTDFVRTQLRAVAASLDLTYEQLTGDLTSVNYSSIRAGLLEIRRRHEQIQHGVVGFQLNRPFWRRWFDDAVIFGALDVPSDYARRSWTYARVKWMPQGWSWVDPEKEIKAIVLAIRAGLITRDMAVAQGGYDGEEIDRENAAINERSDALGLAYDSDGRRRASSASSASDDPGERMDSPEPAAGSRGADDAAA